MIIFSKDDTGHYHLTVTNETTDPIMDALAVFTAQIAYVMLQKGFNTDRLIERFQDAAANAVKILKDFD